jgi:hypothetical protein
MGTKFEKISNVISHLDMYFSHLENEINEINSFDELYNLFYEYNLFNVEIIYYSKAMDYLSKNDSSLKESLDIALQYGYDLKNLNSEILASLHATNCLISEFNELRNEIDDILNND